MDPEGNNQLANSELQEFWDPAKTAETANRWPLLAEAYTTLTGKAPATQAATRPTRPTFAQHQSARAPVVETRSPPSASDSATNGQSSETLSEELPIGSQTPASKSPTNDQPAESLDDLFSRLRKS